MLKFDLYHKRLSSISSILSWRLCSNQSKDSSNKVFMYSTCESLSKFIETGQPPPRETTVLLLPPALIPGSSLVSGRGYYSNLLMSKQC